MKRRSRLAARPRFFRLGPGLLLAILASVAVWAFMPREPGRLKTEPLAAASMPAVASAPDPHWMLRQSESLGLSPAQASTLRQLVSRWDHDTADLRRELDNATADLKKQIPSNPGAKLSTQQLMQEAAPLSALSRQLADARRAWWADARTVMTPRQRAVAETTWAAQWVRRGSAGKEAK